MEIEITADGMLYELWTKNRSGEQVFPHLKSKRSSIENGFAITLTGRKEDYHLVSLDNLLQHMASGDFDNVGRIRMKPIVGGRSNGFAVRKLTMSTKLTNELANRRGNLKG